MPILQLTVAVRAEEPNFTGSYTGILGRESKALNIADSKTVEVAKEKLLPRTPMPFEEEDWRITKG